VSRTRCAAITTLAGRAKQILQDCGVKCFEAFFQMPKAIVAPS
jgi:hypothetical protein